MPKYQKTQIALLVPLVALVAPSAAAATCTATVGGTELLANPGFEQFPTTRATSWDHNIWGGAAVTYARDTASHSGASAQRVTVSTLGTGGYIFKQSVSLTGGTVYQASVWLRSPNSATVDFQLRRAGPYNEPAAEARVTLTPTWKQYVIRGGFDTTAATFFGLSFAGPGTVVVDDASLRQTSDPNNCVASNLPVPNTYMGMHLNQWGVYTTWPTTLQFGTLRLWDTGTRWKDIQPQRGAWNWQRLDYYVNPAVANHQAILYTLGMTPQWASARPSAPQSGAVAEPANIADWRTYVRTVATRYKGRIKYWEIWNEANNAGFYTGTAQKLVELTSTARAELKAVDPTNVVLSPDFTETGQTLMSQYLNAGGGQYFDVASVHWGGGLAPESRRPFFAAAQDLLQRAGVGTKPIWNTEGQAGSTTSTNSDSASRGLLARTVLLEWAWGISNFTWYAWDMARGIPLSQANHVTPTAGGIAYRQVGDWLRGSKMQTMSHASDGTWSITLVRSDGKPVYAVWNVNGPKTFSIPAAWLVTAARNLSGGSAAVHSGGPASIGIEPLLLVP